ncbi:MAG: hypothetical protein HY076_02175 [Candidatus Eisenbacteria bacterium]|uniref:Uncharacterized protein n=1 Tax=Eiseniibacteriota bacterium TaxID=2212470 RepID=A0A9D6QNL6_UNCEI|nr:hypothetical protein [Candidatus Eisenbacteria bacterium]
MPGTPGAMLWLASARSLAQSGNTTLLLVMCAAWLAALTATMRQWRQAFGVPSPVAPSRSVPLAARASLWIGALGLLILGGTRLWRT